MGEVHDQLDGIVCHAHQCLVGAQTHDVVSAQRHGDVQTADGMSRQGIAVGEAVEVGVATVEGGIVLHPRVQHQCQIGVAGMVGTLVEDHPSAIEGIADSNGHAPEIADSIVAIGHCQLREVVAGRTYNSGFQVAVVAQGVDGVAATGARRSAEERPHVIQRC